MMNVMNILIIFGIAAGCIVAERLWPAMKLPRVNAWWGRVILINSIQLGITVLAGQTWNRWLNHWSLLHLRDELSDWVSAIIIYVFSTFVYYWWHRYRHESQFLWRTLHQIHHSARRLEIQTTLWLRELAGRSLRRHARISRRARSKRRTTQAAALFANLHRLFEALGLRSRENSNDGECAGPQKSVFSKRFAVPSVRNARLYLPRTRRSDCCSTTSFGYRSRPGRFHRRDRCR